MRKSFTVDEANRSLQLIYPIASDIVMKMRRAKELHEAVRKEKNNPNVSEAMLLYKLETAQRFLTEVEHHIKELEDVGVLLRDLSVGLIDFPHQRNGKEAYFCWMLGEKCVSFWHEKDEGYAKRKPVFESSSNLVHG